ncbi:MAG: hypothetical protein JNK05_15980 [Myxococcales bacterium]|nr:hypothetical protein [Myxococcales bacterium]
MRRVAAISILCASSACLPDKVVLREDRPIDMPSADARDATSIDAAVEAGADASVTDAPSDDSVARDTTLDDRADGDRPDRDDAGSTDAAVEAGDACVAMAEVCNGRDEDCDGVTDNGFDLMSDQLNCGACGRACAAGYSCDAGRCGNEATRLALSHSTTEDVHACATLRAGEVWCWGSNLRGFVALGRTTLAEAPTRIGSIADATDASSDIFSTCVLHRRAAGVGGDVTCFGTGVSWIAGGMQRYTGTRAVRIAAGHGYVCALGDDGLVRCWGAVPGGYAAASPSTPTVIPGLSGVQQIAVGYAHACAVDSAGAVRCWGQCNDWQCGIAATGVEATAVLVPAFSGTDRVVELAAGTRNTCARTESGAVYCWGALAANTLATRVAGSGAVPPMRSIAAGGVNVCGTSAAGEVYCWGPNAQSIVNQTSVGEGTYVPPERIVDTPASLDHLAVGGNTACGIDARGAVYCWGSNEWTQLGIARPVSASVPRMVGGLAGVTRIAAGARHTCAQNPAGIHCWGSNETLAVGRGTGGASTPTLIVGLPATAQLAGGGDRHQCAIDGGRAHCWGIAAFLSRGRADGAPLFTPVVTLTTASPETPLEAITAIGAADRTLCARTASGGVYCTGLNQFGTIGDGTRTSRSFMTAVAGLGAAVTQVSSNIRHACALRADGRVTCWGENLYGQFGDNSADPAGTYRPTAGTLADNTELGAAAELGTSEGATFARTSSGALFAWGDNGQRELGTGGGRTLVPTRVSLPAGESSDQLAIGRYSGCTRSRTQVFCWGNNSYGQLGDGTTAVRSTPIRASVSDVDEVASGSLHVCARTRSGTVWCWGDNSRGQLGDGAPLHSARATRVMGLP